MFFRQPVNPEKIFPNRFMALKYRVHRATIAGLDQNLKIQVTRKLEAAKSCLSEPRQRASSGTFTTASGLLPAGTAFSTSSGHERSWFGNPICGSAIKL